MKAVVDRDRLVKTFVELAKIQSPSHDSVKVGRIAKYIQDYLAPFGVTFRVDAAGNLACFVPGKLSVDPVMLCGHMDTDNTGLDGREIQVIVEGEVIRTDGTTILGADNKDNLAAILEAVTALLSATAVSYRPFELVFTTGEELISKGAKQFDCTTLQSKVGIISDMSGDYGKFTIAAPGQFNFDGVFYGLSAHSAHPDEGVNAFTMFVDFIIALKSRGVPCGFGMEKEVVDTRNAMNISTVIVGSHYDYTKTLADVFGSTRNAVPSQVQFRGEVRGKDMQVLHKYVGQIREVFTEVSDWAQIAARNLASNGQLRDSELIVTHNADSFSTDPGKTFVVAVMDLVRKQGIIPETQESLGGTDANVFTNKGIETIVITGASDDPHKVTERTRIPDLVRLAELYTMLLTSDQNFAE